MTGNMGDSLLLDIRKADLESLLSEAGDPIMETALDRLLASDRTSHNSFTNRI
jgi:hypothetical protein